MSLSFVLNSEYEWQVYILFVLPDGPLHVYCKYHYYSSCSLAPVCVYERMFMRLSFSLIDLSVGRSLSSLSLYSFFLSLLSPTSLSPTILSFSTPLTFSRQILDSAACRTANGFL